MTSGHAGATPRLPVAVLGSLNTDLIVQVARLPRPGETAQGGDLRRLPGGKGANQAVAAGRLGAYVELIGAIGDDDLGAELVRGLVAEDVGVDAVTVIPGRSRGVALVVVDGGGGENTVTISPGANADVDRAHATAARGLIAAATVLVMQLEVPAEASLAAAELAHRARSSSCSTPRHSLTPFRPPSWPWPTSAMSSLSTRRKRRHSPKPTPHRRAGSW